MSTTRNKWRKLISSFSGGLFQKVIKILRDKGIQWVMWDCVAYNENSGFWEFPDRLGESDRLPLESNVCDFDGINDCISNLTPLYTNTPNVKIEFDFKINGNPLSSNDALYSEGNSSVDTQYFLIFVDINGKIKIAINDNANVQTLSLTTVSSYTSNIKHNLKWIDNNGFYQLHIDDVLLFDSSYIPTDLTFNKASVSCLGRTSDLLFLKGIISNVKQSTITTLLHQYHLDESSGTTAFDCVGSNNGTYENITAATFFTTDIEFTSYQNEVGYSEGLVCGTSGTSYIESSQAYGTWEFEVYKDADVNSLVIPFIGENKSTVSYLGGNNEGYLIALYSDERIYLQKMTGASFSQLIVSDASYIDNNTLYGIKIVRNSILDEYITGAIGTFGVYIKGGSFGSNYVLVDLTGGSGSNPVTDNTYTTSNYTVLDLDTGDIIVNYKKDNERVDLKTFTDGTGTYSIFNIPIQLDANGNPTSLDALGNSPDYTGRVKYPVKVTNSNVALFNGSNEYIIFPTITIGDKMFTAKFSFYSNNIVLNQALFGGSGASSLSITLRGGKISITQNYIHYTDATSPVLLSNTWYSVIVNRLSTTSYTIYVDGTLYGTITTPSYTFPIRTLAIGFFGGNYLNGMFDNLTFTLDNTVILKTNMSEGSGIVIYNKVDNNFNGTGVNITESTFWTTDDGRPDNLIDGFNKKLVCATAGTSYIESTQAYGVWEFEYKSTAASYDRFVFIGDSNDITAYTGYEFQIRGADGGLRFRPYLNGGGLSTLFITAAGVIQPNIMYTYKIVRNASINEYITGAIGTFAIYIKGGAYGNSYSLVDVSGGSGSNPVTDNNYTVSTHVILDLDDDVEIKNLKQDDVFTDLFAFTDDTGVYSKVSVPALSGSTTLDAEGSELSNVGCPTCKGHNGAESTLTQYEANELYDADGELSFPYWYGGEQKYVNSGGKSQTDWIDSNSDGLADDWNVIGGAPTTTIITSSGFSGNVQRVDTNAIGNTEAIYQSIPLTSGVKYILYFKNRSSNGIRVLLDGVQVVSGNIGINTEATMTLLEFIPSASRGAIRFYTPAGSAIGDWFEIDEVQLKEVSSTPTDIEYADIVANYDGEYIVMADVDALICRINLLLMDPDSPLTDDEKDTIGLYLNHIVLEQYADGSPLLDVNGEKIYTIKDTYTT